MGTTKVISRPTPSANGEEQVIRHCENCGYRHEKTVVTTYVDFSSNNYSSSDSWSGGGGDGGGGGGG